MDCETFKSNLALDPQTLTRSEAVATILHALKCQTCSPLLDNLPGRTLSHDEIAQLMKHTDLGDRLSKILADEECLSQMAQGMGVEPERITKVAKDVFGIGTESQSGSGQLDLYWDVESPFVQGTVDSCMKILALAYVSLTDSSDQSEAGAGKNSEEAVSNAIAFLRPVIEEVGSRYERERKEHNFVNRKAFDKEVATRVAAHITSILKGKP